MEDKTIPELKLFVWEGVLTDYTDGMMFAIAHTKEEAIQEILKKCDDISREEFEKEVQILPIAPVGFYIYGGA